MKRFTGLTADGVLIPMSEFLFSVLFALNAIVFAFFFFILAVIVSGTLLGAKKQNTVIPNISIIVPCFNEAKRLPDFFRALAASTYDTKKIELILVDDGSTDNTITVAKKCAKPLSLIVVRGKHLGKVAALNLGVKKAHNEIIICLDADTLVAKNALGELANVFSDPAVGAASGICLVKNNTSVLGSFQDIEYFFTGLIRRSFSRVFGSGIWFFGAIAAFRKSVFVSVHGFSQSTLTEDHDFSLAVMQQGYHVVAAEHAVGYTLVPETIAGLVSQRTRWWFGALQSIRKNWKLLFSKQALPFGFVALNHVWWYIFAVLSLPLVVYQFLYWFPQSSAGMLVMVDYVFRWITFYGSVYLLFMLKQWNLSLYQALGSICGILTVLVVCFAIFSFGFKLTIRRTLALFFYFPYTILLNIIIIMSLLQIISRKKKFFYK